ncbi:dihydroorotate dehydrogenase [Chloroflexia bacterium SDU3-3]|nr:dihydroorotate dehydrogenase [Chloroflexia bacterium SDU3-3]
MVDLAPSNPFGLALPSPVMVAAGCLGYGVEYRQGIEWRGLGALVTRTTTLRPLRVARPPRLIETASGLLGVGPWPNPGIEHVLDRHAPVWAGMPMPVILSIAGSAHECGQIAGMIEGVEGVAGLELAVPEEPGRAAALVAAVRRSCMLPLLAKLPLLAPAPLLALAQAVAQAGADTLTLFAPPAAAYPDPATGELLAGWLAGPAVRPLVLQRLAEVLPQLTLPVAACGGVTSAADARLLLAAGAAAVQLGSALLADPHAAGAVAAAMAQP